jgi:hypothetical protein
VEPTIGNAGGRHAMNFLGVKGNLRSPRPGRAGGRPSIDVWCNPLVGLIPDSRKIRCSRSQSVKQQPRRKN